MNPLKPLIFGTIFISALPQMQKHMIKPPEMKMDQGWARFELVLFDLALLQTEGEMTGD
jgi:hypothetical protein